MHHENKGQSKAGYLLQSALLRRWHSVMLTFRKVLEQTAMLCCWLRGGATLHSEHSRRCSTFNLSTVRGVYWVKVPVVHWLYTTWSFVQNFDCLPLPFVLHSDVFFAYIPVILIGWLLLGLLFKRMSKSFHYSFLFRASLTWWHLI